MYRAVQFFSTFPNEWRGDEEGNSLGPGARELADVIVQGLGPSMKVVIPVHQHKDYGWGWDAEFEGVRFDNVLNPIDSECYLTVHIGWYGLRWLLGQNPGVKLERYCGQLTEVLGRIPQVSKVRWMPPHS